MLTIEDTDLLAVSFVVHTTLLISLPPLSPGVAGNITAEWAEDRAFAKQPVPCLVFI